MEPTEVIRQGNTLTGKFTINGSKKSTSPEYLIGGLTLFQMRLDYSLNSKDCASCNRILFVKFTKAHQKDSCRYALIFSSEQLDIQGNVYLSDDSTWRSVYEREYSPNSQMPSLSFSVTVQFDSVNLCSPFAALYADGELTDFELKGKGGGVRVHKAVLAAHSEVLRGMLTGEWRETAEGGVTLSQPASALIHLKEYMYLHRLPTEAADLRALAALASYYMMEDLEHRCCIKLMNTLTAANACDILQFAIEHNLKLLVAAILLSVQQRTIKIEDIMAKLFK